MCVFDFFKHKCVKIVNESYLKQICAITTEHVDLFIVPLCLM